MSLIKKNIIPLFILAWLIINLIQAGTTELFDDEAYYWVYSRFLSWGYYDHPPMIALLIRIGYYFFHNEFGVRLFVVLLSTASLVIIYDLIPQKNKKLFIVIVCSIAVLQIGGIIAVPDIPLIFFTALFFWLYRRFLQSPSLIHALLLGTGMALLLYSKYHGILIILLTLLSNFKLLRQPLAYVAAFFAVLLFLPHLQWQYLHHFPSVYYHLFERNTSGYKLSFSAEYIAGQLLLAGPFMGWLLLWQSFRYNTKDAFEKALKFCFVGIYLFFLLATFKGRVEANWTAPAWVALIILSSQALQNKEKWKKILWKWVPVTLVLFFGLRIYMAFDITPITWIPKDEFHQNKIWADRIKQKAGDLPVVFLDSYQQPSKYWFYTGEKAFSLNTPLYRRNNFNLWPLEVSLSGKQVYAVINEDSTSFPDIISKPGDKIIRGKKIDSFYSYSKVNLLPVSNLSVTGKIFQTALKLAPGSEGVPIPFKPYLFVFSGNVYLISYKLIAVPVDDYWKISSADTINLPPGKYEARFAILSAISNLPSLNSSTIKLTVNK